MTDRPPAGRRRAPAAFEPAAPGNGELAPPGASVSPNQALTLSEVPVVRAGSAGAVLQTGQRIGSAIGIAAVGSVFFSAVASTHGDWSRTFLHGIVVVVGFVFLALAAAAVDVFGKHRPDNGSNETSRAQNSETPEDEHR